MISCYVTRGLLCKKPKLTSTNNQGAGEVNKEAVIYAIEFQMFLSALKDQSACKHCAKSYDVAHTNLYWYDHSGLKI